MPGPGALLDVDGTLLDTNWLHVVCWSGALRSCGVEVPMHVLHRHIGMGAERFVPAVAGREVPGAAEAWEERFAAELGHLQALPGAADLCRALHAQGRRVVLASSAKAAHRDAFLQAVGAGDAVGLMTTADDVAASKPAPDIFAVALADGGCDPAATWCLGDTVWDVEAALGAGLGCVGVLTGGIDRRDLEAAGAAAVYEDCAALVADLRSSPFAL